MVHPHKVQLLWLAAWPAILFLLGLGRDFLCRQ
jgi:hypothetical protein